MEESVRFAKQFLEDLLSFFGLNTDVHATHADEIIELSVPSTHLNGFLIGQRGETLRSIQFLVSVALRNNGQEITRVNVDVADYKRHRNERLERKATKWAEDAKASGETVSLKPMSAADRRIVHQAITEVGGLATESEGEGRDRHIVIKPLKDETKPEEPASE